MNDMTTPPTAEDAAWATLKTPFTTAGLQEFCRDVERLFRINPHLEFNRFERLGDNLFTFSGRNLSQETPFDFEAEFTVQVLDDGLRVDYDRGIKSSTVFRIEPGEETASLTITDYYDRMPDEEREAHLGEVDRSLVIWGQYLQRYMLDWQKYSKFWLWRWYMRRVWQPMKPMARRITYILLWITVAEIALIALGAGIYFAEFR
jgi:hypothetical protein